MTAHTPGPWRVGDAGHTVFGPKGSGATPVCPAIVATGCELANAALIARAPSLLADNARLRAALADMVCRTSALADFVAADFENGQAIPAVHTEVENSLRFARAALAVQS